MEITDIRHPRASCGYGLCDGIPAGKGMRQGPDRATLRIDYEENCRCGHPRAEHHRAFGCMRWDARRAGGWCTCDGFARRERMDTHGRH
jgi:hypothetical protein